MPFDFSESQENECLVPVTLPDKEAYYYDLLNIKYNFTGRVDAWTANTFIKEASQLIVNAIKLFEMGYFDCAFYSLRQSLEVSTTMVYLVDIDEEKRQQELSKWKSEGQFPMHAKMLKFLKDKGETFRDFREKLNGYFEQLDAVKSKLNKHVHKQGFDKFYVARNHPVNRDESRERFIDEFRRNVESCIGAIAVFRLALDPFPILLNDEEMYHRTGDMIPESYTDEFIDKYIGIDHIENYKNTEIYQAHFAYFAEMEKKKDCVSNVVKHQYINLEELDEILEQKHLLSESDLKAVLICESSEKIAKVYALGGLLQYFTNRKSSRTKMSWDSRDFDACSKSEPPLNIPYDEAFISCFVFGEQEYFLEHNETLSGEEIKKIETIT